jgi:hypothetical protein
MKGLVLIVAFLLTCTACAPSQLGSWWLGKQIDVRSAEYFVRIERSVAMQLRPRLRARMIESPHRPC